MAGEVTVRIAKLQDRGRCVGLYNASQRGGQMRLAGPEYDRRINAADWRQWEKDQQFVTLIIEDEDGKFEGFVQLFNDDQDTGVWRIGPWLTRHQPTPYEHAQIALWIIRYRPGSWCVEARPDQSIATFRDKLVAGEAGWDTEIDGEAHRWTRDMWPPERLRKVQPEPLIKWNKPRPPPRPQPRKQ